MTASTTVIVVYPYFQALDAVGPREVLSTANWIGGGPDSRYRTELASQEPGLVESDSGLVFQAERAMSDPTLRPDTLFVTGGVGAVAMTEDESFLDDLKSLAARSRRVVAICTGAFLLAEIGALDGRSATTHWSAASWFADRYENVALDADKIFVESDGIWTSAGVTAGIDLTLELVRLDRGEHVAAEVARNLVVYLRRSGGQNQYSSRLAAQQASHPSMRDVQTYVSENPGAPHSVAALAERAVMSERTFQRTFKRETGTTPGKYVERVRIDRARHLLETTSDNVGSIAGRVGFRSLETFHRAFKRQVGVTPGRYRGRFRR